MEVGREKVGNFTLRSRNADCGSISYIFLVVCEV